MSSRVLGMVRDILLAALFSRTVTDAFVVAFRLPNTFRRLLGEGSLSAAFVPVFVEQMTQSPQQAKKLAQAIFSLLLAVTSFLTVLGVVFMEPLLQVLVGGQEFMSVPGKFEQTLFLARIMFAYLFLVSTYAFFMAVANALGHFLVPALGPALFNLTFIIFALLPQSWSRVPGEWLAWGVTVGGFAQAALVALLLKRLDFFPRFTLQWRVPGVFLVLRNMLPGILGLGVHQLMALVNLNFASRLPEGSHSYIYWADRLLELPQSLIAISLGAALLPVLSELLAQGKRQEMLETSSRYLRLLLFLALPSAVGLLVLALPMVQVLFVRGSFGLEDAIATAQVVQIYALLLVVSSVGKVVVPGFYAIKNTWLPAVVAAISLAVHIVVASMWVESFGLVGLAGSTALAGVVNMVLLLFFYRRMVGAMHLMSLLKALGPMFVGLVLMGTGVHFGYEWLEMALLPHLWDNLARALALGMVIGLGAAVYMGTCRWMGSPEAVEVFALVQRRFQLRRKGRS